MGGNPAKPIRTRFDNEMIELLQAVCWWDFEDEKLVAFLPTLCDDNLEAVRQILRNSK